MKLLIDIPHEAIIEAYEEIKKKEGICKILPKARFILRNNVDKIEYTCLVCDDRMGGKQTGIGAQYCENCLSDEEI